MSDQVLTSMRHKSSCFEGLSEAVEEGSVSLVSCEAKDWDTVGPHKSAGAIKQFEAQRPWVFQQEEAGAFLASIAGCGAGVDLEGNQEVVGDGDELLPGTVGSIAVSGNGVKGKLTFEDADDFFVFAAPGHEVPDVARGRVEVGSDGTVLVVAVVGVEEIELVVFGRTMQHAFSIDHDPQRHTPLLDRQGDLEATHCRGEMLPLAARLDDRGELQPSPERHLDAISGIAGMEQSQDGAQEKGCVHAEVQAVLSPAGFVNLSEEVSQERDGGLAIVDVTGSILHSQDLTGLGEIGGDGIVALNLAVMRVEAPEGSLNGKPRGDDRSIDINGKCAKRERFDRPCDDLSVDRLETSDRGAREVSEPAAQSTQTRQVGKATETLEEEIAAKEVEVAQAASANDQESHNDADHRDRAVVAAGQGSLEMAAYQTVEANRAQVANEKLEPGVGTQARFGELDTKIALDGSTQRGFSISHSKWPFVCGFEVVLTTTSSHNGRPFCKYESHEASEFMTH